MAYARTGLAGPACCTGCQSGGLGATPTAASLAALVFGTGPGVKVQAAAPANPFAAIAPRPMVAAPVAVTPAPIAPKIPVPMAPPALPAKPTPTLVPIPGAPAATMTPIAIAKPTPVLTPSAPLVPKPTPLPVLPGPLISASVAPALIPTKPTTVTPSLANFLATLATGKPLSVQAPAPTPPKGTPIPTPSPEYVPGGAYATATPGYALPTARQDPYAVMQAAAGAPYYSPAAAITPLTLSQGVDPAAGAAQAVDASVGGGVSLGSLTSSPLLLYGGLALLAVLLMRKRA